MLYAYPIVCSDVDNNNYIYTEEEMKAILLIDDQIGKLESEISKICISEIPAASEPERIRLRQIASKMKDEVIELEESKGKILSKETAFPINRLPSEEATSYYFRQKINSLSTVKITGYVEDRSVYLNDNALEARYSQSIRNHSPDKFSWGYTGSGCAQLALAILLELLPKELAVRFYQQLKFDFVSQWQIDKDFEVEINLLEWLNKQLEKEKS